MDTNNKVLGQKGRSRLGKVTGAREIWLAQSVILAAHVT